MRIVLRLVVVTLVLVGLVGVALPEAQRTPVAAKDGGVGKSIPAVEANAAYWTPERLASARPYMPTVMDDAAVAQAQPEVSGVSESEPGRAPQFRGTVKPTVLFNPKDFPMLEEDLAMEPSANGGAGLFSSERVHGMNVNADRQYPYITVGKLYFTGGYCSAGVIRRRLVVTAGHCLHSGNGSATGWHTNYLFVPAYRDGAAPLYTWTARYQWVTGTWYYGGGGVPNGDDYGFLEMNDRGTSPISYYTGYLGYQTNALGGNHLHMIGYPANFDSGNKMHQITAQAYRYWSPNNYGYGSDMRGGSSGGPWIQNFGTLASGQTDYGKNRAVAVTSWGWVAMSPKEQGASTFDSTFSSMLSSACARRSGNC